MQKKNQVKLRRIKDLENPGQFLAEEIHIYDGPAGKGSLHFMYRIRNGKMQYRVIHDGPEGRKGLPAAWTEIDEFPVDVMIKKFRVVTKKIAETDFDGNEFVVVEDDFKEAYFEAEQRANPHPARAVIEGS